MAQGTKHGLIILELDFFFTLELDSVAHWGCKPRWTFSTHLGGYDRDILRACEGSARITGEITSGINLDRCNEISLSADEMVETLLAT